MVLWRDEIRGAVSALHVGKPITLIGIAFSTKKRTVSGVKIVRDA